MEVFDEELASYGIFVKHARKSIEKEKISVSGNVEIETINIETLQKKGIKCLDIKSKKIKNITFAKDISLDMFFSGVTFTDEIKTDSKFTGELDFSGCTFKEEVNFQQANFENFLCSDTIFEKQVSFLSAVFGNEKNISFSDEKQVSFLNTVFGNEKIISFSDVKFLNLAIFTNTIFNQKTNFEKVYFYDTLLFNSAEFKFDITLNIECKKEAHFINAFAKKMTIYHSTFEKSLDLDITFTLLEILKIKILENLNLHQSEGVKVSMASSIVYGVTNFSFANIKTIFLTSLTFKEEIHLYIYNLKKMQNINFEDITFGKLFLQKELFEKSVNFERCIFLQDVNFKDYTFNEITFNTCTFKESAYFNNSNFTKGVDFHESEFEKTACFYGVKFDETPNFSQALFKGNINIINSNLNFDFTKLDKKIILLSSQGEGKYDYEIANDFRDSFRTFKNALIKDSNLLDASNFHKYELYCKELELKFKKPKIFSREWIDKWQLFFYRKLCDHHTDLLLNLRWLVVVVGFFVSVLFVLRYGDGNLLQFFNKDNNLLKILKAMLNIKALNDSNVAYLILLYSFIGLFFVRTFFIFYYLVIFILMLAMSPYNLFSVVNFVTKDQSSSSLENIIMVAYTLIMILVLFSLQKTARKSSIVPN